MKKITLVLLLIQSAFMMAQTKTVVTQYGEKVTISPYSNNGLTATGGYIQLGGTLIQNTTIQATPSATLALLGLQAGASTDKILVADPTTGVLKLVDRSTFGDNLGNHTATQDLAMEGNNINNAANITATAKTTTATAQITTGAGTGRIAVSDAAGNVTWTDPATISVAGDNLGNHTATQDLAMSGKNIDNAANITATAKTTTATAQITTGAGAGRIAVSDATGNVTWTDPATISVAGDNLGNHTATQDLAMSGKNIDNAANITATAKTTTATAQITTGAGAGRIAVSDATGNVTWTDPATISVAGDNLGNHTATQDLAMSGKNIDNAANITATAKTTTATAQITTGAGAGKIAVSDATGNVTWTDPATIQTITSEIVIDEFNVTTDGTDTFTLSKTPTSTAKLLFHINGVCISTAAISLNGNTVTYTPANNASYALMTDDLIRITYLK
ncbi:hypothetical protein [Flavobacterium ginsenosidimutans]|uniref:hypothetical protein n=1 Tax=Flavobacterium ginsenosidimutans TaxID=687844 RepID=UPI003D973927